MHIQKVHLKNIRSFENLEIDFGNSGAGWHVILGTNGTGKSTLIRSIALALVGERDIPPLTFRYSWHYWLRGTSDNGGIQLMVGSSEDILETTQLQFKKNRNSVFIEEFPKGASETKLRSLLFSAAYGSFRRITGGSNDYSNIWNNHPKLAAHLSCFGEDIALDQSIEWLDKTYITGQILKTTEEDNKELKLSWFIWKFINDSNLLPNSIEMDLTPLGVFFRDKNHISLPVNELSDGYRSILSLTLELIRQLSKFHFLNTELFFDKKDDKLFIKTSGVVLIDEIDAHLHPTWQAKIGKWFTEYFPNIQFIVTTHSPIICRSADTGTIWKLSNEGKSTQVEKIEGIEKKQLIYGNILDAFETDLFGEDISRSEESKEILKEMAVLNVKRQVGRISDTEETRLKELEQIFPIDAKDNFLDD